MAPKYEWYESDTTITIHLPIPNTKLSNIDIYISDLVLKVNVPSQKYIKLLDLKYEV